MQEIDMLVWMLIFQGAVEDAADRLEETKEAAQVQHCNVDTVWHMSVDVDW